MTISNNLLKLSFECTELLEMVTLQNGLPTLFSLGLDAVVSVMEDIWPRNE